MRIRWAILLAISFVMLAGADFVFTCHLAQYGNLGDAEDNWIARWFLERFDWLGLAVFKSAVVLAVLFAVRQIYQRRPRTATRLLLLACLLTAGVAAYGAYGMQTVHIATSGDRLPTSAQLWAEGRVVDQQIRNLDGYRRTVDSFADDLAGKEGDLGKILEKLMQCSAGRDPARLCNMRIGMRGYTDAQCLAANLIHTTLDKFRDDPAYEKLSLRLHREFRDLFGLDLTKPGVTEPESVAVSGHATESTLEANTQPGNDTLARNAME